MRRALVYAVLFTAAVLHAQTYTLGPESQLQRGVPKGVVTSYKLEPGSFYPGTPHAYSVYVPAQYNAAKPIPFMIFLDGSAFLSDNVRVPVVFDNLIAKRQLPPMIGIFVEPGILPAISDKVQNRFERVFEYDSMSDRYSRFLVEELIPAVARRYNLSADPNDRALCGLSTGAVGAFMAAWNQPDQFHRVLSFIGTYVAMKGADTLPALIRKTEPKPIRVFLQDGSNDHIVPAEPYGTFYAGSWPINNQVMYQALEYAGYDATLVMGNEGHNMKQGAAILPDALRWLWRDYPQPIMVHEPAAMHQPGWDPRGKVYSIVWLDKPWQQVGGTYKSVSGPVPDASGNVFFADPDAKRIYKSDPEGHVSVFVENSNGACALTVGPDGQLYAYQRDRKRIVSYGRNAEEKILIEHVEASDLAITAGNMLYFADQARKTIGVVDPAGHDHIAYAGGQIALPAGLALSPDQGMLVVSDAQARESWSFQIAPDGSLINGEPFYRLQMPESGWMSGVGGVAEDANGQVYFATPEGIQICEANGRLAAILNSPGPGGVSHLALAGPNLSWLYATSGNNLYRRPVRVVGTSVANPAKPPKPPL